MWERIEFSFRVKDLKLANGASCFQEFSAEYGTIAVPLHKSNPTDFTDSIRLFPKILSKIQIRADAKSYFWSLHPQIRHTHLKGITGSYTLYSGLSTDNFQSKQSYNSKLQHLAIWLDVTSTWRYALARYKVYLLLLALSSCQLSVLTLPGTALFTIVS